MSYDITTLRMTTTNSDVVGKKSAVKQAKSPSENVDNEKAIRGDANTARYCSLFGPTNTHTHKQTHKQTGAITIHCAA